jgi:hypothetical protein
MRESHVMARRARETEWEAVRALRLAALSDTPDAFGSTYEEECAQPRATNAKAAPQKLARPGTPARVEP